MGLFDKKTRHSSQDDFSSPNETIDLTASTAQSLSIANDEEDGVELDEEALDRDLRPRSRGSKPYGIEEAIVLMRSLPADSVELVVRVVKHTLESANIEVSDILREAQTRKTRIESDMELLKEEITAFEAEISDRNAQIDELETDHKETTLVEERLELAQKLTQNA